MTPSSSSPFATASRAAALAVLSGRDAVLARALALRPGPDVVRSDALPAAIAWLLRTHEATGRQGSSKGFSLLHGWLPAYPETTGYVIGTLLEYEQRGGEHALRDHAVAMGDWEVAVQRADGGVLEGAIGTLPARSVVFNTGMVLHGWEDLIAIGEQRFAKASDAAGRFLLAHLREDGTWDPDVEYSHIAHTYNSRVAWAMVRLAIRTHDEELQAAARRQLDWVLDRQRDNGWFEACVFKPGMLPNTHGIAYTLRGLLECSVLLGEPRYVGAVERTSEVLIRKLEELGTIPATWDEHWRPMARYECLTGTVQLGGVWLRLWQVTQHPRFLNAGLRAVALAAARQERMPWDAVNGALAGSFPLWGRYAPMQYPNWATKFLADSLMLRDTCRPALA